MDIKVIIKDVTLKTDVIKVTRNETSAYSTVEETRNRNILSSRLDFMTQSLQEKYRKSVMFTSRQGPIFPRYSHKEAKVSVALCGKFSVLPEIRGQNLFVSEKERSYDNNSEKEVNVEQSKVDTLRQLQSSILHYGSKSENIWMGFNSSKYHPMLVRPGFSARRYLANLFKNLNEDLIKKLMCEGYLLENNLYTTNPVMPHIRRRLSDDLSRYPEPYRILRHMLMAPGPLNEYSFVWSSKKDLREDISFMYNKEMEHGDIKILSKKIKNDCEDEFEEVQYAKLSGHKKKTILSNLLMKSAMNHALRVKEEMMEYNKTLLSHKVTGRAHNIHIPVVKFDMKVAITDLLTKETLQTLTTTEIDLPFNAGPINNKFKGYGLKVHKQKEFSPIYLERNDAETAQTSEPVELDSTNAVNRDQRNRLYKRKLFFNEESVYHHFKGGILKRSKVNVPRRTNLFNQEEPHLNVFDLTEPIVDVNEDQDEDKFYPQNLTLTLNEAHPHKHNKKMNNKSDSRCGKESVLSDSNINLNPLEEAMKNTNSRDVQTQGLAFAKMIRERAQMAKLHNENIRPYGKYRDPGLADSGDIDPTISFVHWKYKDDHSLQYASEFHAAASTDVKSQRLTDAFQKEQNHSRLVTLLRGQADSVAEAVLARSEGGVDFASDVNVALRDIIGESQYQKEQVWNLEVNDLKKENEYKGVITNIFKSIFKDELQSLGGEDLDLSPTLMKLLQNGYNLKLEDLEMVMDPVTGRMIASLKKGVKISKEALDSPTEMLDDSHMSFVHSEELSLAESRSIIASSLSPFDINRTPTVLTPEMKRILQSSNIKVSVPKIPSNQEVHGKLHAVSELGEIERTNENEVNERIEEENKESHDPQKQDIKNVVTDKNGVIFDGGEQERLDGGEQGGLKHKYYNVMDPKFTESDLTIDKNLHKVQQDHKNKEELFSEDTGYKVKESLDQEVLTNSIKGVDIAGTELIHKEGPTESRHTINIDPSSTQEDRKNAKGNYKTKNIPESIKNVKSKPSVSQKLPTVIKAKDKGKKNALKGKNNAKKDFNFGHTDETKDINQLYNNTEPSNLESIKSKKSFEKNKNKKNNKSSEEFEKEDSGDIHFQNESTVNSINLASDKKDHSLEREEEVDVNECLSEEEIKLGDGDEIRRQNQLMRQNRVAQKRAEVQRLRKEEEMKRKKAEEDRKVEAQRLELEELMRKKLEEERKRKEEEFLLQKEREKEEEQALLDAEKRKECFRLRQIEKERQQREEFNRIIEEARIRQAIEDRLKKEEQEMREREEAALLEKMNEDERNEYLKRKAKLLEKQRLEEEEERMLKEERARVALEEAKAIAKQQALEKARIKEIRKMRIEDEGLKKYLNVTPAFVWSYFEFLNILGVN